MLPHLLEVSDGTTTVLAIKSDITIKHPPNTKDIGITYLCFDPNTRLTTWGAIKSINPIVPLKRYCPTR